MCWIEMRLEDFRMFGKHQQAQATVLDAQNHYLGGSHVKKEYVLEVRPPTGPAFRATGSYHFVGAERRPQVGDVVTVKYHLKSLKVKLDLKEDPRYGAKRAFLEQQAGRQEAETRRAALLGAPPGTPLASAALRSTLTGHTQPVRAVAWSPDGRLLASGSQDNTLRIWSPESLQPVATLDGEEEGAVWGVAWSPDGRLVAFSSFHTLRGMPPLASASRRSSSAPIHPTKRWS